jgi:hypothetical protein
MTKVLGKFAAKKAVLALVVGVVLASMPSCKHQEDCGAYQGSGKSTRSHKKQKRYSSVISINNDHKA